MAAVELPTIVVTPGDDSPATNVPVGTPGVPAVANPAPSTQPELMTQDAVSQFSAVFGPQWGIFSGGAPVITAQSVVGFEFRNDWTLADYPVEGGKFESYDKVLLPFLAKIRLAQGGSVSQRSALLNAVKAAADTLNVYSAVTPEIVYRSCNISHYDYRRTSSQGLGLIVIDVWLTQVLVATGGGLGAGQVQNPSSADSASQGSVQTEPGGNAIGSAGQFG